jgi:rRNA maturation RNase YbeY
LEIRCQLRAWSFSAAGLSGLLRWQLKRLGRPAAGLSLLLCGDAESARLNGRFRSQHKPTDILSFPSAEKKIAPGSAVFLGDLALNLPFAWRKRGRFAASFSQEVSFLLLHGTAHLLGYHHDSGAQERALDRLCARAMPAPAGLISRLRLKRQ